MYSLSIQMQMWIVRIYKELVMLNKYCKEIFYHVLYLEAIRKYNAPGNSIFFPVYIFIKQIIINFFLILISVKSLTLGNGPQGESKMEIIVLIRR